MAIKRTEKQGKKQKQKKKKNLKNSIIISVFFLLIIGVLFYGIGMYLYDMYRDTFFPAGVVEENTMEVFGRQMDADGYKKLFDIATELADNGNGVLLTPTGHRKEFDYDGDILIKLTTSTGGGFITVAQGSGNIVEDITKHAKEYANFIGTVTPSYMEKVSEIGVLNGYHTAYSSGYLKCGNALSKEGFYLTALEYAASDTKRLFLVYTTKNMRELGVNLKVLEDFAALALEGDREVPGDAENASNDAGEKSVLDKDDSEFTSEDIDDINSYISDKYGVTEQDGGSLETTEMSAAVSENSVMIPSGDEIAVEITGKGDE